jgi:hypothetical protein
VHRHYTRSGTVLFLNILSAITILKPILVFGNIFKDLFYLRSPIFPNKAALDKKTGK